MITPEVIIKEVCAYYDLTKKEILSKTRKREIITPRQMYQTLLKENTRLSLAQIGMTTFKNHATIIHATKTIHNLIETDWKIKRDYDRLNWNIRNQKKIVEDYCI